LKFLINQYGDFILIFAVLVNRPPVLFLYQRADNGCPAFSPGTAGGIKPVGLSVPQDGLHVAIGIRFFSYVMAKFFRYFCSPGVKPNFSNRASSGSC